MISHSHRACVIFAISAATLAPIACVSTDGLTAENTPPATDSGTSEADGPDGIAIPPGCDLTRSPKDSVACIDDAVAIFVAPAPIGSAIGAGTKASPISSIDAAITKAASTRRSRIYLCEGTYAEPIRMLAAISVYGGFDCTWKHTGVRPLIRPTVGPAIDARSVPSRIVIENVDAVGGSPTTSSGPSSIGALVVRSTVELNGVVLSAGPGRDGIRGSARSNYSAAAATGKQSTGTTGGAATACMCLDMTTSQGGRGADGNGANTTNGSSVPPVGSDNVGGSRPSSCDPGGVGADGAAVNVSPALGSPGIVTETGWDVSKRAAPSPNGRTAQGGGGGGAVTSTLNAGAGGGCGGCGGAGGDSGGNGGASIGLVSFESTVTIIASTISSGLGGAGGAGGDGQPGQSGGAGGDIVSCDGGSGGSGSGGGGGPGGAGGDSITIAWKGRMIPAVDGATTLTPTNGGGFGAGGKGGAGSGEPGLPGSAGIAGQSIKIFASP